MRDKRMIAAIVIIIILSIFGIGWIVTGRTNASPVDENTPIPPQVAIQQPTSSPMIMPTTTMQFRPPPTPPAQSLVTANPGNGGDTKVGNLQTTPDSPIQKRLVVKNATLRLAVNDVQSSLTVLSNMAENMGGWIVTATINHPADAATGGITQGTLIIRVPAERLDDALHIIRENAQSIQSEEITGQDVTQQYSDLNSQLKNLEAAETQLRSIMDKAVNTQDVLVVYNQLVQTRGQIENIKGQMTFFEQSAAFSSIGLTLIPVNSLFTPTPLPTTTPFPTLTPVPFWQPEQTVQNATDALNLVFVRILQTIIWLIVFVLPLMLLLGVPLLLLRRLMYRYRKPKAAPPL